MALWYSVRGQIAPVPAVRGFAEYTAGKRGAPYVYGAVETLPFVNEQRGLRVGGELSWRDGRIGGAFLHSDADSVPVFGLPFDTLTRVMAGHDANGWEVSGITPTFLYGFALYGNVVNWLEGAGAYMPTRLLRVGLQHHSVPMRSGNLELYGRVEWAHRGEMITPDGIIRSADVIDAYLQIRIIDVRIFGRFEDTIEISDQVRTDVAGRPLPGPRIFYGVKWHFWN
jgi:hypothetical protein